MNNCKFKEIATFSYGKMPNKNLILTDGKYPVFSGYQISGYYDTYNTEEDSLVLIARGVGGTGEIRKTPARCWLTNLSIKIEILSPYVLKDYLFYKFQANDLRWLNSGSAQPQITINDLSEIDLVIPELSIQQHIVDILGTLDDKIENLELKIQKLITLSSLDYRKLLLDNVPNTYLSQIATVESGKRPVSKNDQTKDSINIPIIGATEIVGYTDNYLYNEPILVIGRVGTHGIVQPVFTKSWPTDNTLIIKTNYFSFVYNVLKNIDYSSINKGSTQPLITQTDIKNMPIYLPGEKDILDFEINHPMLLVQDYHEQIDKLRQLKQLYLQKFFG